MPFILGHPGPDGPGYRLSDRHREQPDLQALGAGGHPAPHEAGPGPAVPLHPGTRATAPGSLQGFILWNLPVHSLLLSLWRIRYVVVPIRNSVLYFD